MLWTYLRRGPSRFRSSPWYGLALRGRRLPLEPAVKLFGPALIAYIELYGDHAQFRCAGATSCSQATQTHGESKFKLRIEATPPKEITLPN